MNATEHFKKLQKELLDHYGAKAKSVFIRIKKPDMQVHVLEAGKGTPLLIFHGGDGEAVNWAPIFPYLQDHFRIIAVDRPGFGLTDHFKYSKKVNLRQHARDFVESVLDALKIDKAIIVGGSMGGFFATVAALDLPERVERLILAGYAVGITKSLPLPLRIICGVPGLSKLFMSRRPSLEAQHDQYKKMFHVDISDIPELYFQTRIAGINLPSEKGVWATLLPLLGNFFGLRKSVNLENELSRIKAPSLMMLGDHDMATPDEAKAIMAKFPRGKFEHIKGIGHFPFLEAPEKTAELIKNFCK